MLDVGCWMLDVGKILLIQLDSTYLLSSIYPAQQVGGSLRLPYYFFRQSLTALSIFLFVKPH
jgi:hypothetical protein